MKSIFVCGAVVLTAIGFSTSEARADGVPGGSYILGDHPDGGARAPGYGLRLDELANVSGSHDIFTFSFDHPGADMRMDYDAMAGTVRIFGTAYGGLDVGSSYSSDPDLAGFWEIDFTYENVSPYAADGTGIQDIATIPPVGMFNTGGNTGTITRSFDSDTFDESYDLIDYFGSYPYTFRFGDDGADTGGQYDPPGHRGFDGLSGWGWMNHSGAGLDNHVGASDWLFTAEPAPMPVPGSVLMGVLGLGMVTRRRRAKAACVS